MQSFPNFSGGALAPRAPAAAPGCAADIKPAAAQRRATTIPESIKFAFEVSEEEIRGEPEAPLVAALLTTLPVLHAVVQKNNGGGACGFTGI
jgi:hypothetical protein